MNYSVREHCPCVCMVKGTLRYSISQVYVRTCTRTCTYTVRVHMYMYMYKMVHNIVREIQSFEKAKLRVTPNEQTFSLFWENVWFWKEPIESARCPSSGEWRAVWDAGCFILLRGIRASVWAYNVPHCTSCMWDAGYLKLLIGIRAGVWVYIVSHCTSCMYESRTITQQFVKFHSSR